MGLLFIQPISGVKYEMKFKITIDRPIRTRKVGKYNGRLRPVYLTENDELKIARVAALCGMTLSSFLRTVGIAIHDELIAEIREHKEELDALIKRRRKRNATDSKAG